MKATLILCLLAVLPTVHPSQATKEDPGEESKDHSAVFEPVGYYAAQCNYLHIRFPMPMQPILDAFNYTKNRIPDNSHFTQKITQKIRQDAVSVLDQTESQFRGLLATMPQQQISPSHRKPRFAEALASAGGAAAAVGGIALGVVNLFRLQGLDARMNKLEKEETLLKDITQLHENHLKNLDSQIQLQDQVFQELYSSNPTELLSAYDYATMGLQRATKLASSAISHAQRHRLAPGVFPAEALKAAVHHAKQVAEDNDYINYVHHTSDLFQLEASFLYNPVNKTLVIILHIPMVKREHLLTMHKYVPLPLASHFVENASLVAQVGHQDIIAARGLEVYKILSSSDLIHCLRFGNHHFCEGSHSLKTNFKSTCLGSIFIGDLASARTQCSFVIQKNKETVLDMGNGEYRIYTSGSYLASQVCYNHSTYRNITNGATLKVPDGCRVQLKQHLLVANEQEEVQLETENRILTWSWNMGHLFPNVTEDTMQKALRSITNRGFHNFDASDLLHQLDIIHATPESEFYSSGPSASLASVILIVVIVGLALLGCCLKKRCSKTTTSVPSNLLVQSGRVAAYDQVFVSASAPPSSVVLQMPPEAPPKGPVKEPRLYR